MYLSRLEIQGFKSFAQKTVLDFPKPNSLHSKGITAIVGPNGSGKSNVADSIRWVMGEQSLKLLRGKKSEDVIFAGSEKTSRLGFAEVSLHFNNENGKAPIDYREITITRRIYRSGEAEYFINKTKCRLYDIELLLAKANFGQRTYSIIGQGMIDSFLMMTAEARKKFFDEATGVKPLQIKKSQSITKLEKTKENLKEAELLINEIEPRLRSLTRQVNKLEQRKEIEGKLQEIQVRYYSAEWNSISLKLKEERGKLSKEEARVQKTKEEINELQKKFHQEENSGQKNLAFDKLQSEYNILNEQKNKCESLLAGLQGKIEWEKEKINKAKEEEAIIIDSDQAKNIKTGLTSLKDTLAKAVLLIQKNDRDSVLKAIKESLDQMKELVLDLMGNFKTQEIKIDKSVLANIELEKIKVEKDLEAIASKLKPLATQMEDFSKNQLSERKKLIEYQNKLQAKQNHFNQEMAALNNIKIEVAKLETKLEDLNRELEEELTDVLVAEVKKENQNIKAKDTDWAEMLKLKRQLELIGGIDPETKKEYEETKERYEFLVQQSSDLQKALEGLEKIITNLEDTIKKQFHAGFKKINDDFIKYFKILFNGGQAKLVLKEEKIIKKPSKKDETDDEEEEYAEEFEEEVIEIKSGIEIEASPPGKKLRDISMLSGGEKALTSIALICSIIYHNPAPFVLLDEVDAALDEANSIRFASIIRDLSHRAQFIVITHNRATMEKAQLLYGVTMGDNGISKLLSLKLDEAEKLDKS